MVTARHIRTYSFLPPATDAAVPGLSMVLRRMLATDRGARFRDAAEASEAMGWVVREPDADLCRAMLEERVVPALRALFLRHWAAREGAPWRDAPEAGRLYLAREVACNREAAGWPMREQLEAGDSAGWDLTALCTVLLRSGVHPLKAAEAPQDHADAALFQDWRGELAAGGGAAWSEEEAARRWAVMWGFVERHLPDGPKGQGA